MVGWCEVPYREVVLAPTPLGVRTTRRFMIINKGYDNLEIACKLPAGPVLLTVRLALYYTGPLHFLSSQLEPLCTHNSTQVITFPV